ncbi:hypothetical protein FQR65_LT08959 [Abscondita terminalis]|nr:hypothetical protein FQR65_LT08959 [Abscondita terminalis]
MIIMIEPLIRLVFITWYTVQAASTPDLPQPRPSAINKIADVSATCDSSSINITVIMEKPFKGLLFTKDFPHECHATESLSYALSLHLPTSGCGVRLNSKMTFDVEEFFYETTLVIQQDRYLQQATDLEYTVKCVLQNDDLVVKSKPMVDAVKKIIRQKQKKDVRSGRLDSSFKDSTSEVDLSEEVIETLSAAKAWMEIIPEQPNDNSGILQVGEPTLLIVKSTLPVGIGWKIVDCTAHDGLGDSSQKLLDEKGCPIDELLLATPLMGPPKPISQMRHQEVVSKFSAFKFPDRDRLHLSCGLQICRGNCEKINCTQASTTNTDNELRLGRTLSKGVQGEVIDRFEVYNSVEVIAPGIEIDEYRSDNRKKGNDILIAPFGHLPGDKTFCISSEKMAITFALLGLIFLLAVIVAIGALMKARRSGSNLSYYSKSLFSSTSSNSRFGGSRLLLHECPSIRHSMARGVPYGRVF